MFRRSRYLRSGLLGILVSLSALAWPQSPSKPPAQDVPAVDGGLGPCSLEITVNNMEGKPVYAATVKVHIAHGFGRFHKLDLEGGTNSDGKVKFTGLPNRVRQPPLEFRATKDQLAGVANYDPAVHCRGQHSIVLEKPKPPQED